MLKRTCAIWRSATAAVSRQGRPYALGAVSAGYAYGDLESDRTERVVVVDARIPTRVRDWVLFVNLSSICQTVIPFPTSRHLVPMI
jgi:hypothetical protein